MKIKKIENCARCKGEHKDVEAKPLTYPIETGCMSCNDYTHWATCPTNGEPILINVVF